MAYSVTETEPTPLVSVVTPCFNSSATLPWAIASVLSQTYKNWEMIIVDDGSTDHPERIVEQASDPRIRLIRLDRNRGRGYARQVALSQSRGEYLTMVDADDWIFPNKIELQLSVMARHPELAVVSSSMGILDTNGDLVGIRSRGSGKQQDTGVVLGPLESLIPPPVPHGPSMIRMDIARQFSYDEAFRLGQDSDFMLRVMMDRCYLVLPQVTYVYTEHESVTQEKVIRSLAFTRKMFSKHTKRFPVASRVNIGKVAAKEVVYRVGFKMGLKSRMIQMRSNEPSDAEIAQFTEARAEVALILGKAFGTDLLQD